MMAAVVAVVMAVAVATEEEDVEVAVARVAADQHDQRPNDPLRRLISNTESSLLSK